MGGRLDATNVVRSRAPRDRHHRLRPRGLPRHHPGRDRRGRRRACCARAASPCSGPMAAEARAAIARQAEPRGRAPGGCRRGRVDRGDVDGGLRRCARRDGVYRGLRPLPGAHQRTNLLVAVRLLEAARGGGRAPWTSRRVPAGIAATRWPGRLQRVPGRPPLLLDGAHNAAGARALADYLRGRGDVRAGLRGDGGQGRRRRWRARSSRSPGEVVLTRVGMERAAEPDELALARAERWPRARCASPTFPRALRRARELAGPDATVVVAGSLYLVGRSRLQSKARRSCSGPPATRDRGGRCEPRARRWPALRRPQLQSPDAQHLGRRARAARATSSRCGATCTSTRSWPGRRTRTPQRGGGVPRGRAASRCAPASAAPALVAEHAGPAGPHRAPARGHGRACPSRSRATAPYALAGAGRDARLRARRPRGHRGRRGPAGRGPAPARLGARRCSSPPRRAKAARRR